MTPLHLTPYQRRILIELCRDAPTTRDLACRLMANPNTLRGHLYVLTKKLCVNSKAQLILAYLRRHPELLTQPTEERKSA